MQAVVAEACQDGPVAEQGAGAEDEGAARLPVMEDQGGSQVAHGDALQHAGDARVRQRRPGELARVVDLEEGEPVQQKAQQKDQGAAPAQPGQHGAMAQVFILAQRKGQRIADDKQKAGKDQVRDGKSMPFGMQERRIHAAPVARGIDDDHQGDGQAAQDVEGEVVLRCNSHGQTIPNKSRPAACGGKPEK